MNIFLLINPAIIVISIMNIISKKPNQKDMQWMKFILKNKSKCIEILMLLKEIQDIEKNKF